MHPTRIRNEQPQQLPNFKAATAALEAQARNLAPQAVELQNGRIAYRRVFLAGFGAPPTWRSARKKDGSVAYTFYPTACANRLRRGRLLHRRPPPPE